MGTWAGVVRVSHLGDRKAGADSFHADREQVEALERYAAANGATLQVLPAELDVSGGLPLERRPSLLEAVEGVERGDYQAIAVAYLSRLGRSMQLLSVWDRVEAAGGRIIAVQEGIDTSTPTGRHMRNMLLSQATMERELHSERFEARRRDATAAGIWQRRQTPTGYSRDAKTRKLVPNEQAGHVREAFRDRAAGVPLVAIASKLRMTPSGARHLLKNDVYLGVLRVGQHVNPAAHEALVDRATFEAAQVPTARPARALGDAPALLAGLVRCSGCGHVMTRKRTANVVYGCPVHHSGERCPAPASVTCATLDAYVERIALAELERLSVTISEGDGVERAKRRLAEAEHELGVYVEAVSAADIGAAAFAAGARKRRDAVEAAQGELRAELGRARVVPSVASGADVWADLNGHERNQLLRSLLAAVVVARAGGRGARVPLEDRVRVLAHGADLRLPERRGGAAAGIVPLALPDFDDASVLRAPSGEDAL
jgi:DNA invertase Pin-like site-specific DNA recombinase